MSKPLSAVDCISPAFAQTKKQLFAPFRWGRWSRLALVCLLTGEVAGGGGGGPSGGFHFSMPQGKHGRTLFAAPHFDWGKLLPWLPWIVAGVVLLFLLIFFWLYIASVYRFVLFDSVLYNRCQLKGSWARWEPCGRSYFFWTLALSAITTAGTLLLIGAPVIIAWRDGLFHHPGEHLAILILGGAALLFLLIAFFVVCMVAGLFAKDFCVPIMGLENVGVLDAWRRLLPMMAAEKLAFTGYVLIKIVLAIGNAILVGIATLLTLIVILIPVGILALLVFFGGKALGLGFNVATISILVVIGGMILASFIYAVALINTAPMVFFQSYVLHFLGSRYETLGAVLFPPPAPPPTALPDDALPIVG